MSYPYTILTSTSFTEHYIACYADTLEQAKEKGDSYPGANYHVQHGLRTVYSSPEYLATWGNPEWKPPVIND